MRKKTKKNIEIIVLIAIITIMFAACKITQQEIELESIAVTIMPDRTEYRIGEEYDPAGKVITAFFNDGSSGEVTGYTLIGFDSSVPGIVTITVSFEGKTAAFTVMIFQHSESFTITFAQITNAAPSIEVPTIYILAREGKPAVAVISVSNPDQYDTGSIRWHVNGDIANAVLGNSITLDTTNYTRIGEYSLTVEVKKDGIPYNKTITFVVVP